MTEPNCICKTCGKPFYTKPSLIRLRNGGQHCSNACKFANPEVLARGAAHPHWKGNAVGANSGRARARRLYLELGSCELCGNQAVDRHHVDGNTANNAPENVQALCRRCHMNVDGRLGALASGQVRKLTAAQAEEIRNRYAALPTTPSGRKRKGTVLALAAQYDVGPSTVKAIVSGRLHA